MVKRKTGNDNLNEYFSTENLTPAIKTRAIRSASITIFSQALSFLLQTLGTIVLARLLSPGDFGLVTMVLTFSLLLGNFGANGLTEAVIQAKEINHKQISTLFWINLLINGLLAVIFIMISPFVVWFYKEPRLTTIILIIAASNLIGALSVLHIALLKRRMNFLSISVNEIAATIVSVIVPIVLAYYGWGYWAIVVKWALSPLIVTFGAWIICNWRPGLPSSQSGVKPMLSFTFNAYGNFVVSYLRRNIDKMVIGRFFGTHSLGCYDRA